MKALFLDRDGIINVERGEYTWRIEDFQIMPGIIDVMRLAREQGYKIIVITNQAGIARGLYKHQDVAKCHKYFQQISGHAVDAWYYAPGHPSVSASLSRKPDSLLFEKAIYRFDLRPPACWMVGDKERDLIPARKLEINTMLLGEIDSKYADKKIADVMEIIPAITSYTPKS